MIIVPRNKDAHRNEERFPCDDTIEAPCWICGRPVRKNRAAYLTLADCQVVDGVGGVAACTPEEFERTEEGCRLYGFPVGPDCRRRHPELAPYLDGPHP